MQTLSKFNDSPDPKEHLVFLHANGFPPDTYTTFLSCISPLGQISTIEHRPLWQTEAPQFLDWRVYASDAIATLRREAKTPVWLVGHSMGGAISLLIAKAAPDLVKGVVALDPVTIDSSFLAFSRLAFRLWPDRPKMIRGAIGRPHRFSDHGAAFDFYRGKRAFTDVSDKELMDYVLAAHVATTEGVELRFSGAWEACVYRSPPNLWRTLKTTKVPVHVLGGERSYVITPKVANRLRSIKQIDFHTLDAGHLLPMEKPQETAGFVINCLGQHSDSELC